MAGNASTTMLLFSSLSFGVLAPDPLLEHPAATIAIAAADAASSFRDLILAPQLRGSAGGWRLAMAATSGYVTRHHMVAHRGSHAEQYDLSVSGITELPSSTQVAAVNRPWWHGT